jgi:hypothetical protein
MILLSDDGKVLLDSEPGGPDYNVRGPMRRIRASDICGEEYPADTFITGVEFSDLVRARMDASVEIQWQDRLAFKVPWEYLVGGRGHAFPEPHQSQEEAEVDVRRWVRRHEAASLAVRRDLRARRIGIKR